jgi:hypothetical protein
VLQLLKIVDVRAGDDAHVAVKPFSAQSVLRILQI